MKKGGLLPAFLLCFSSLLAQDFHFSQFYNSPLTLNPAITGKMNGVFRFALNYRNQWFALIEDETPFATYSGSFDAPIQFRKDALGLGLVIVNDRSGEGRLNNTMILGSVAYHLGLGSSGRHVLSIGVQAGYNQKRLDMGTLLFYNQFDQTTNTFNPNLPYNENIPDDKKGFFDLNAGIVGTSKITEKVNAYAGFSVFHLTQPEESFLASGDENLPVRYVVHGGAEYVFHKRVALLPSLIYMRQRKSDELNLGTAFVFKMAENENVLFYLGGYYRLLPSSKSNGFNLSDAAIAYTAFEYKNFRIAFSFDATTSDLRLAPKTVGAFEIALIYTHPFLLPNMKPLLFCPRF
ncbi:MAG TPA: PorP/SprF family type IX secretion system membrane protein [Chitinophagales bacterium]|nr:PorP/SprF family type IX secretion system membrane protein [Chitinophagales bacterium]